MLVRYIWMMLALFVTSAGAQGNLDQGKTPAQLYASDCATCHKSPQSVTKTDSVFGLEIFLSKHYTTSRESAALLATYLKGLERPSTAFKRGHAAERAGRASPSEQTPSAFGAEDEPPRPPKDVPN